MRVTCLIDSLGSGGAQRQLCTLAVLLRKGGLDVNVLTYHRSEFFRPLLDRGGVRHEVVVSDSSVRRAFAIRRALRDIGQDVVLAFLEGSCLYAELAALPTRKWGLVVSERLAVPKDQSTWFQRQQRRMHRIADYVTTNSHANRRSLETQVPCLRGRVVTIYNTVDLSAFAPGPSISRDEKIVRLVVLARYQSQKNLAGLIDALSLVRMRIPTYNVYVDWYGDIAAAARMSDNCYASGLERINARGLSGYFRLHDTTSSATEVYRDADAVVLPSFYEGLPNTICEAMACGRPVLMSDVCDASYLVSRRRNGLLFNPHSSEDIANAIISFASMSIGEREALGACGRKVAEAMFDPARFASHYTRVLELAAERRYEPLEHSVPEF